MAERPDDSLAPAAWPEIVRRIRARTPARIMTGRAGAAYRTETQLQLREWKLFEVCTEAPSKDIFLLQPHLGRHFSDAARPELLRRCSTGNDLQLAIGDGLSVDAVAAQVPALLPLLTAGAKARGWTFGQPFVIRHCRVGILNEIGELLTPKVAVLLIGERPGLATAESLSAYMAYRPQSTHTDADRNLISNIHAQGTNRTDAAARILNLAAQMMHSFTSGYGLREEPSTLIGG
jgi:ethanolamine ammonia-lyase small subunit